MMRAARKTGTRRDETVAREKRNVIFLSRPSFFSFNCHFLRMRLLGIKYSMDLREKADYKQSMVGMVEQKIYKS